MSVRLQGASTWHLLVLMVIFGSSKQENRTGKSEEPKRLKHSCRFSSYPNQLWQCFNNNEELEVAWLLNPQQPLDVDACSSRQWRSRRDGSRRQRRIEPTTIRLIRWLLERGPFDRYCTRGRGWRARRRTGYAIIDRHSQHRSRADASQVGNRTREGGDVNNAEP